MALDGLHSVRPPHFSWVASPRWWAKDGHGANDLVWLMAADVSVALFKIPCLHVHDRLPSRGKILASYEIATERRKKEYVG